MPKRTDAMNRTQNAMTLSPRQRRVLRQLIRGYWIRRESVDSIACVSNGPAVISELRGKGLKIRMQRVRKRDSDGNWCRPGRYKLEQHSMSLAHKFLGVH